MKTLSAAERHADLSAGAPVKSLYLWIVSSSGALGGLLFGYDWVVIGGAKPFYEAYFHLTTASQQGWAMSCALAGCLIGAVAAGPFSERLGRKPILLLAAFIFAISPLGTALSHSFLSFVAWRITGGSAIGLASGLSPLYIAEIAPARLRGKLVSLNQLMIVIGILLAQIVNWLIARPVPAGAAPLELLSSWNDQTGWRWMFGVTAIPSLLFLGAILFVPESPRWLARHGSPGRAREMLARIGGNDYAQSTLKDILDTTAAEQAEQAGGWRILTNRRVRPALIIGIVLAVLQQWCGINVIFNYAEEIFSAAGYRVSDILFNIVVTGAVNLIFTIVALFTVDKIGRRALLIAGCSGLAAVYAVLGTLYRVHTHGIIMLSLVVAAIACYAMSLAPVTWVIISEIFPGNIRSAGVAIATSALWIASFALTYSFPILNSALRTSGTFYVYAFICIVGGIFVVARLPETKGKSLEEIERVLF